MTLLSRLALEAGSETLAREAQALADRLAEGRFYVACVGEFKRGKSTLINALVGRSVLPTGVVPVTSVVTVVRCGESVGARVRFGERDWEECDPGALSTFVSEEHNPDNQKGVTAVEVFLPNPLLASGMGLVDTPGIGSVSIANAAATRSFIPHIDAALVVLGSDPPITGEELGLIAEIARDVPQLIMVLNKADRLSADDLDEVHRFTERVVAERFGQPIDSLFRVSAVERLTGGGPARDWAALVERLEGLARQSGADLVKAAEARGAAALIERLLAELDAHHAALLRPIEESEAHVDALRRVVSDAGQSRAELGHRLTAVQERLSHAFIEERDRFFEVALPDAQRDLRTALQDTLAPRACLRDRAIEHVIDIAKRWLDRWRQQQEPHAEALYREGAERFAQLVRDFQESLQAIPGLESLPHFIPDTGLRAKSGVYYTALLTVAPSSRHARILDRLRSGAGRLGAIEREASEYLTRLLAVNSARIANDFRDRVAESRRRLEAEIREQRRELIASGERALAQARHAQAAGAAAVAARLEFIAQLRGRVVALREREA